VIAGLAVIDKPANLFLTLPESRSYKAVSSPLTPINAALLTGIPAKDGSGAGQDPSNGISASSDVPLPTMLEIRS
jgi:hypothetical protein